MRGVEGVEEVTSGGAGAYDVTTGPSDVREALNTAAAPFGLLESRSRGGLEELYLRAVSTDPTASPSGDSAPDGSTESAE